jgi:hypothetical protein
MGGFPLHVPLTDRSWRDGGRAAMGVPMFVADFNLAIDHRRQRLRVSEGRSEIVTIAVRSGGMLHKRHDTQPVYGALGGQLLAAPGETSMLAQVRPGGARLRLGGAHPWRRAASLDIAAWRPSASRTTPAAAREPAVGRGAHAPATWADVPGVDVRTRNRAS